MLIVDKSTKTCYSSVSMEIQGSSQAARGVRLHNSRPNMPASRIDATSPGIVVTGYAHRGERDLTKSRLS